MRMYNIDLILFIFYIFERNILHYDKLQINFKTFSCCYG